MRPLHGFRSWLQSIVPARHDLRADVVAGLPGAVSSVPDGMASGVLAGVNPVLGLYASFAGPIAGGLGTSTRLMVITTTSASALAAGSAISGLAPAERERAIVLVALLAGVFMLLAGLLRLGRYTRFVSHSVMLGFLTGIAFNIVFGQLTDLTGVTATGSTNLAKAIDVITQIANWDVATLLVGLSALAILIVLARTRLAIVSSLIALVVPTIVVVVAGLNSVTRVDSAGPIPRGLPLPELPHLGDLSIAVVAGAAAVAAIVLVQGAGVAQAAPNDDGPSDANRDFIAQGAGNLASGVFGGMPVGGSVGQTALNISVGGRSRWAAIWSGIWMVIVLVAFSGLVGAVAMPTLGAILIFAAVASLRPGEIRAILTTGINSRIAMISTFLATLLLPVSAAVGLGVVISLLLQLNQEAIDLAVTELVPDGAGHFVERDPPKTLPSHAVTVLDVYGSLFYAGARTLQARLPDYLSADQPVVLLRLRGRVTLGATFFAVVSDYAERLATVGGRLYLTGLDPDLAARLGATNGTPLTGSARLYVASPTLGLSTTQAYDDATTWLVTHRGSSSDN